MPTPLTIGSLFSGIGGLELGLERAGLGPVVWQVEKDAYCRAVLAKHWPDATRYEDVKDVGRANAVRVDIVCGGFPCQDISYAGKGAGLEGERSGLWYEFARIVRELAPRYVVVENVSALLTRGLDDVLGTLADSGYDAEWSCLRAFDVGAPHLRDRLFIVAHPSRDLRRAPRHAGPATLDGRGSYLADSSSERLEEWEMFGRALRETKRAMPFNGSPWESEPDVGRVAHGIPRRVDRLRALGNAVVPQVAEVVGRVVLALEAERMAGAA